MTQLKHDKLHFEFPEIAAKLTTLLEQHLRSILPAFGLPVDRDDLFDALQDQVYADSTLRFQRDRSRPWTRTSQRDAIYATAHSLTAADVEKTLRERAFEVSGLNPGSFAGVSIAFQRTMRIPDDDMTYPLPAGFGRFPLHSVDDFADTMPALWAKRGGVLMPIYQSEALWIDFSSSFPFAVKIAAGKVNAVSGEPWTSELTRSPQGYVVLPDQPWLDGFAIGKGLIRQFVAMPLGDGYSVEDQLTGKAEVGGIQLQVYPMRADSYFLRWVLPSLPSSLDDLLPLLFAEHLSKSEFVSCNAPGAAMSLGMGGKMQQEIYRDRHEFKDWDQTRTSRCFVHLCNSLVWRQVTGTNPPHPPLTAKEYQEEGIPWFDYYRDDLKPLKGSERLAGVKSVAQLGEETNSQPLPENASIAPELIVQYGNTRRPGEIREFCDGQ